MAERQHNPINGVEQNTIKQFRKREREWQHCSRATAPLHHVLHFSTAVQSGKLDVNGGDPRRRRKSHYAVIMITTKESFKCKLRISWIQALISLIARYVSMIKIEQDQLMIKIISTVFMTIYAASLHPRWLVFSGMLSKEKVKKGSVFSHKKTIPSGASFSTHKGA